ncbi:MAG: hypothetical protein KKB21_01420 [Nanoarchaeota archaeon]|nr:hypothetical protein [Nanoarchaeota archaeon]
MKLKLQDAERTAERNCREIEAILISAENSLCETGLAKEIYAGNAIQKAGILIENASEEVMQTENWRKLTKVYLKYTLRIISKISALREGLPGKRCY